MEPNQVLHRASERCALKRMLDALSSDAGCGHHVHSGFGSSYTGLMVFWEMYAPWYNLQITYFI